MVLIMEIGRVKGSLVLNKALPSLKGKKLKVVEEIDACNPEQPGKLVISFDYIGTGDGELVLYECGPESALAFYPDMTGSDTNILAIVDEMNM